MAVRGGNGGVPLHAGHYLCIRRVEALFGRSDPSGGNLNRPQEPRVFHDGQET